MKSTVEKSPNAPIVLTRDFRSLISGIEKVRFSVPTPRAVWRMEISQSCQMVLEITGELTTSYGKAF